MKFNIPNVSLNNKHHISTNFQEVAVNFSSINPTEYSESSSDVTIYNILVKTGNKSFGSLCGRTMEKVRFISVDPILMREMGKTPLELRLV